MKFKNKSKILTSLILLNSIFINSSAGVLSDDTRYETFNENNITINDILEEDNVDVKIYGNTVNNIIAENNKVTIKGCVADYPSYYIDVNVPLKYPLRANTEYTISLNVKSNGYKQPPFYCIMLGQGDVDTGHGLDNWSYRLYWNTDFKFIDNTYNLGKYQVKFTTPSRIEETSFDHIKFIAHDWHNFDSVIEDIAIYEGDQLNKIPFEYKNGIESSFEYNLITQDMINSGQERQENLGKYKVDIKSTGKNLFNSNQVNFNHYISKVNDIYTLPQGSSTNWIKSDIIQLKPNTVYTININCSSDEARFAVMDDTTSFGADDGYESHRLTSGSSNKNIAQFITNDKGTASIYICTDGTYEHNRPEITYKFQIEEDSVATEYELYKERINTFYLSEPLRGLSNGVQDRIVKKNGQWMIERNCASALLDGDGIISKEINHPPANDEFVRYNIENVNGVVEGRNAALVADRLPYIYIHSNGSENIEVECISNQSNKKNYLNIVIKKSRLTDNTVLGFTEWLSKNPIEVVYNLEEPIYESLNIDSTVNIYLGTTHVTNNSNIATNMEVVVDRAVNRAKEAMELAKNYPTVENLSKARYWNNLLKESILKDDFQNEVNNITNIEGLDMEKKTASVNSDIYIKMKNMISLSLDTNSIVFDEVDSTENTEFKNAVNLTVNSSLPYRVNAYLEGEIYNADKTATLDKSSLNIKASNKDNYQIFTGSSSAVTLLDDQDAGTNNIHGVDLRLTPNSAYKTDVYKTSIKFEVEQK